MRDMLQDEIDHVGWVVGVTHPDGTFAAWFEGHVTIYATRKEAVEEAERRTEKLRKEAPELPDWPREVHRAQAVMLPYRKQDA
jgi:hypothetical protein